MRFSLFFVLPVINVSAWLFPRRIVLQPAGEIPADVNIQDQLGLSIQTPDLKARRTSKLILGNGLKVFIVSDPGIVKAGAALSVETGSWRDPDGVSGLGIASVESILIKRISRSICFLWGLKNILLKVNSIGILRHTQVETMHGLQEITHFTISIFFLRDYWAR
jgi:hypothetical protein